MCILSYCVMSFVVVCNESCSLQIAKWKEGDSHDVDLPPPFHFFEVRVCGEDGHIVCVCTSISSHSFNMEVRKQVVFYLEYALQEWTQNPEGIHQNIRIHELLPWEWERVGDERQWNSSPLRIQLRYSIFQLNQREVFRCSLWMTCSFIEWKLCINYHFPRWTFPRTFSGSSYPSVQIWHVNQENIQFFRVFQLRSRRRFPGKSPIRV